MNLYDIVGSDAEHFAVVGGVMDLAQGETILDNRQSPRVTIGDNLRGVEQFAMRESADRTFRLVGQHDLASENRLMQASFRLGYQIPTQHHVDPASRPDILLLFGQCQHELVQLGLLGREVNGRDRVEDPRLDPVQPDQRQLFLHRSSQTFVLSRTLPVAAQLVPMKSIRSLFVGVWTRLARFWAAVVIERAARQPMGFRIPRPRSINGNL